MSGKCRSFNRPKDWQAFERLTRDLFQRLYSNRHFDLNGRSGYPQGGVDVYGTDPGTGGRVGVQCKGREDAHFNRHAGVTEIELRTEVERARQFPMRLGVFVFLTTGPNDPRLHQVAQEISDQHRQQDLFRVEFHAWDWLEGHLGDHERLAIDYDLTSVVERSAPSPSVIAQEIGGRLRHAIDLMNADRPERDVVTIQSLSRYLGLPDWRRLEQISVGQADADAAEIEDLASRLGIAPNWLLEGKSDPFYIEEPEGRKSFTDEYEAIKALKPETVYFIRGKDSERWSSAFITVKIDDIRWRTFTLTYPIRGQVGGGGRTQIFEFCCLVRRLSMGRFNPSWSCRGLHLGTDDFNDLLMGRVYPGALLEAVHEDSWWDDFAELAVHRISPGIPHLDDLRSAVITAQLKLCEYREKLVESSWRRETLEWAGFPTANCPG